MSKAIVHDRVDERLTVEVVGGTVLVHREYRYRSANEWRVDPEAGISFGAECLDEFIAALRTTHPKPTS